MINKVNIIFNRNLQTFILLILLPVFQAYTNDGYLTLPPNLPVKINVDLIICKIYNINTVDETYQIDGYLTYKWNDERLKDRIFKNGDTIAGQYENDRAKEIITQEIWFPICEFINVQGIAEIPNMEIKIDPTGKITYYERFFGTFSSNMDYRKFPFDSQSFFVKIEPFSYHKKEVVFFDPVSFFLDSNKYEGNILEEWKILYIHDTIETRIIPEDDSQAPYSRVVFEVKAKRVPGYYLWQVLFPLFIIILSSFLIFWIKDFNTQIGVGFTLMLTVVAFNFYSASILPKLPYNTFIESIIIVGYIFIFLGIIAVIANFKINGNKEKEIKLLKLFRYLFPLVYLFTMILICFLYRIF